MKILQLPVLGLAVLAVSACNETSQPSVTQTAQLPCHCTQVAQPAPQAATQTAAAEPAPVARHFHRHLRHWAWSHESETASSSYDVESSESRSVDRVYQSDEAQSGTEVEAGYSVWVDGYGRKHCYYTGHHHHDGEWQRVNDDRSRLDPWKGYDDNDGPENGY